MRFTSFLKSHYSILAGVFLLQVLFLGLAFHFEQIYMGGDSREYLYQAENFKNYGSFYAGEWKDTVSEFQTRRTPAYGFFIYLVKFVSGSHFAIIIFQNLLLFLNFTGLLWVLKDVKLPKKYLHGFLFLALLFFPTRFVYSNMIMSEILLETFVFWSFFMILRYLKCRNWYFVLAFNILLSLAVLTKPVLLYFWIPNTLFWVWLYFKDKNKYSIASSLILPATIAALCFFNYKTTGYFHYSSIKTFNLVNYNVCRLLSFKNGPDEALKKIAEISSNAAALETIKDRSEFIESTCYPLILDNSILYSSLQVAGMVNFFIDPGRFDLYIFAPALSAEREIRLISMWRNDGWQGVKLFFDQLSVPFILYLLFIGVMNLLVTMAAVYGLFRGRINFVIRFFAGLVVAYFCVLTGVIGCARFKLPVFMLIVFAAVVGIEAWYNRKNRKVAVKLE